MDKKGMDMPLKILVIVAIVIAVLLLSYWVLKSLGYDPLNSILNIVKPYQNTNIPAPK